MLTAVVAAYCIVQVTSECCKAKSVLGAGNLGNNAFCNVAITHPRKLLEAGMCGDGSVVNGHYCGVGSCDVFGCNCDGGCLGEEHAKIIENCTQIIAIKQNIIDNIKYCTNITTRHPPPNFAPVEYYTNDCPDTCDYARYRYHAQVDQCNDVRALTLPGSLVFQPGTALAIVYNGYCELLKHVEKNKMIKACGV